MPTCSHKGPILRQKGAPEVKVRPSILSTHLKQNQGFPGFRGAKNTNKSSQGANGNSKPKLSDLLYNNLHYYDNCWVIWGTLFGHVPDFFRSRLFEDHRGVPRLPKGCPRGP